ncbi:MAG: hypothetical protein K6G82_04105 [Ruminococcus sp.]|nr:hypothetical protein [Ruminococcus sp.]
MRKLIPLISAAVLTASLTLLSAPAESFADESDTIKIMCIGDSITDGYVPEYTGSYRKFIYHGLTEKGYKIDMVGSKDGGYNPTYTDPATGESFEYDNENTGYSGYAIKAYPGRSGILETLQQTKCLQEKQPDIVTLQIGTNNIIDNHDLNESVNDLRELIDFILANIPEDSALFVSTIPAASPNREGVRDWFGNYRHSADWQTQYDDATVEVSVGKAVKDYNEAVAALCSEMKSEHSNIAVCYAGSTITDDNKAELLFDGVHPNNDGYKAMGDYWTELLGSYLGGEAVSAETSAVTTETASTSALPENTDIMVNDLVTFSRYLLGDKQTAESYAERLKDYDLVRDGVLDTFDLVQMRKLLVRRSAPFGG